MNVKLLTTNEAAKIIGWERWKLQKLIAAGKGPRAFKVTDRAYHIREDDFEVWLNSLKEGGS